MDSESFEARERFGMDAESFGARERFGVDAESFDILSAVHAKRT